MSGLAVPRRLELPGDFLQLDFAEECVLVGHEEEEAGGFARHPPTEQVFVIPSGTSNKFEHGGACEAWREGWQVWPVGASRLAVRVDVHAATSESVPTAKTMMRMACTWQTTCSRPHSSPHSSPVTHAHVETPITNAGHANKAARSRTTTGGPRCPPIARRDRRCTPS